MLDWLHRTAGALTTRRFTARRALALAATGAALGLTISTVLFWALAA